MFLQYVVGITAIVWLLAVYKVFLLDDTVVITQPAETRVNQQRITKKVLVNNVDPQYGRGNQRATKNKDSNTGFRSRRIGFESDITTSKHSEVGLPQAISQKKKTIPLSSEWSEIHTYERRVNNYDQKGMSPIKKENQPVVLKLSNAAKGNTGNTDSVTPSTGIKSGDDIRWDNTSHLQWPPVRQDGTIPESDGFDIMPIIDLKVPKFWYPPIGSDWNKVGSKINHQETIFLMIASYRDFQCKETITLAFLRADHPERLFVGAVDQTVPGDDGCLDLDIPCSADNTQPICKYRDQISVFHVDASKSTGPVTARHIGDRMYRGQYFVMQMDAHCSFVRHWDTLIIKQWKSTQNEMAVLT